MFLDIMMITDTDNNQLNFAKIQWLSWSLSVAFIITEIAMMVLIQFLDVNVLLA